MLLLRYSGLRLSQALVSSSDRVLTSFGCNEKILRLFDVYITLFWVPYPFWKFQYWA